MSEHELIVIGQRWISDAEPELGLGLVSDTDHRSVSILFPAADKTRVYAKHSAPITRVRFAVGDEITSRENDRLRIETVHEEEGLLTYAGSKLAGENSDDDILWLETSLNDYIQLTDTRTRLFSGQVEHEKWFDLKIDAQRLHTRAMQSDVYGLAGCRISPIPHQLYIANSVAARYAPRALLADEVGLGKTIEAGLIVHKQLLLGLASRVLVVVPPVLIHQWLVEWLRRFNLKFSIFDQEKVEILSASDDDVNPFDSEQLVLCDSQLFESSQSTREFALNAPWDIVVVDEAHHVHWSPQESSTMYDFLEALSVRINGLLLLTATPEQLGEAGHFARLHLLDADRFSDYDEFIAEHDNFASLSAAVAELNGDSTLSDATVAWLHKSGIDDTELTREKRASMARHLIDLHGTSRVLFRNTRETISGFPQRVLHAERLTRRELQAGAEMHGAFGEIEGQLDIANDPRVDHLLAVLRSSSTKMLLIASRPEIVIALEQQLRERHSIRCAVFHEHMSLVERDRAAAYFADPESVARLLLCSEIGSEGRNFQFVQSLYLFDIPEHPDLLEQRIGRLDRIGQKETIYIYVPYVEESDQELLFRWYHEGMNAFTTSNAVGQTIYSAQYDVLDVMLKAAQAGIAVDKSEQDDFVQETQKIALTARRRLAAGRDRLIEIASFDPSAGEQLRAQFDAADEKNSLPPFLGSLFDAFGVNQEFKNAYSTIIKPDSQAQLADLPGLDAEGRTVTFDRHYALAHEDIDYLTWEHPFVRGVMDMLAASQQGKCAAVAVKFPLLPEASVLVETHHVFAVNSQAYSELALYFNDIRHTGLFDKQLRDLSKLLNVGRFWNAKENLDASLARQIIKAMRSPIERCIDHAFNAANQALTATITRQKRLLDEFFAAEQHRLTTLKQRFGNVHAGEIDTLMKRRKACAEIVSQTQVRLEQVRLIVIRH